MTQEKRIEKLEQKVAELEARIVQLERGKYSPLDVIGQKPTPRKLPSKLDANLPTSRY
jgi:hypothetical protein